MSSTTLKDYPDVTLAPDEADEGTVRAVGDWFETTTEVHSGRGRFYVVINVPFANANSKWVASITEVAGNGFPQRSGAHLTVNEVVAEGGRVAVAVWIDNVPVNIRFRIVLMGRV